LTLQSALRAGLTSTSGSATMVHLNAKPRNILLDQELCPKISGVGVANLCLDKESKRSRFCNSISDISSETRELVKKMIIVGLWCVQTVQTNRPSMSRVIETLESTSIDLELPVKIA
jgi:hypothetical protein